MSERHAPIPTPMPGPNDFQGVRIDARGLRCPLPVLRLRKVALPLAPGTALELIADDPAAEKDVPLFCAEMGWVCDRIADGRWRVVR
ncbi:sulfurtransferase TusA family protein [Pacificimonas sp. ICDLI1SI03]